MNDEELRTMMVNFLYDMCTYGRLDLVILNSLTENFGIDAYELCEKNGITYYENE